MSMRAQNVRHKSFTSAANNALPALFDDRIYGESAVLIPCCANSNLRRDLVLPLNCLVLRRSHVAGKRDEQVSSNSLLDRDICSGRSLAAATG